MKLDPFFYKFYNCKQFSNMTIFIKFFKLIECKENLNQDLNVLFILKKHDKEKSREKFKWGEHF